LLQAAASSLQAKLEPASEEVKANLAVVAVVLAVGSLETVELGIVVLGGTLSAGGGFAVTVQLREAGVASVLPAASVARTENWCEPTASDE
jgi:hypothetical protein